MTDTIPHPGSHEAWKRGCRCPRMDNAFGRGMYRDETGPVFVVSEDCALHGRGQTEDVGRT